MVFIKKKEVSFVFQKCDFLQKICVRHWIPSRNVYRNYNIFFLLFTHPNEILGAEGTLYYSRAGYSFKTIDDTEMTVQFN